MPVQDLGHAPASRHLPARAGVLFARLMVFGGAVVLTSFGVREMMRAVEPGGLTILEWAFLVVFSIAFGWIAQSACAGIAGAFYRRGAPVPPAEARTVLVMPIYNEDASRTSAALQTMAEDLIATGQHEGFEIFIISDSTNPDVWVREAAAANRLREAVGDKVPVWYRRRHANTDRKAGNVKEFVTRWGARYDYMIVLDADSLMAAGALTGLRDGIAADPQMGLLQSAPVLAGRSSLFARMQQFAGRVHGPIAAQGVAVWAGDGGNFWGHNAIIRVSAFAESCGLPHLKGPRPIGGSVMSHDFVEAALLRRRGWRVRMAPELEGSWEESPPSLLDAAARDRRWAQGNLQHAGVIGGAGLALGNRLHFAIGIMSYLASPLWLLLLTIGVVLSVQARLAEPNYFQDPFGLFPSWPRFDAERMLQLFGIMVLVLLTPKMIGLVRALFTPKLRRGSGGATGLISSSILELMLSTLYAPIMLLIQCQQLFEIVIGKDSGWNTQQREEAAMPWGEVSRRHAWHVIIGVTAGAGAFVISPAIFLWLSPTLVGMVLAIPLSRLSGSRAFGAWLRRKGLLLIPEEVDPPALFARRDALADQAPPPADGLRAICDDPRLRKAYLAWFTPRPAVARGEADLDRLSAGKKIADAQTLDEALSWLTAGDRRAVLGDPALIEALATLPRELEEDDELELVAGHA